MKAHEAYWKEKFNEAALKFENDADIAIDSHRGFERNMFVFLQTLKECDMAGKKILDVGCGSGTHARIIANMNTCGVVGIDFSEEVIIKAINKSHKSDICYLISALPNLPFKNNSFDFILCKEVLQCVTDEHASLSEMGRILKKDGILILIVLNSLSIRVLFKKIFDKINRNNEKVEFLKRYTYFDLKNILKNEGFNNFKVIGIYGLPRSFVFLEKQFEKHGIFEMLDKMPLICWFVAHGFLLKAKKIK